MEDFPPAADRIHLANGTLKVEGSFTEGRPDIVRSKLPVAYRPNTSAPTRWFSFLRWLRLNVRTSEHRQWLDVSKRHVKVNGTAVSLPTDTVLKMVIF